MEGGRMMKLLQKLLEIRKSVEYIQKTEAGNQGVKYVDPAVLVKKIRDGMNEHKILLVPSLNDSSVESIKDHTKTNPDATSFLFKSNMLYRFMDTESTDTLEIPWFITGKHMQDPAMAGGTALTYFERYFMLKFFQIPTSKDDPEYFAEKTKEKEAAPKITIGQENVNWLMGFYKSHNITTKKLVEDFKKHYKFNPYGTTEKEFAIVRSTIETDYNEA